MLPEVDMHSYNRIVKAKSLLEQLIKHVPTERFEVLGQQFQEQCQQPQENHRGRNRRNGNVFNRAALRGGDGDGDDDDDDDYHRPAGSLHLIGNAVRLILILIYIIFFLALILLVLLIFNGLLRILEDVDPILSSLILFAIISIIPFYQAIILRIRMSQNQYVDLFLNTGQLYRVHHSGQTVQDLINTLLPLGPFNAVVVYDELGNVVHPNMPLGADLVLYGYAYFNINH